MSAPLPIDDTTEWLEADGLGGFASGTTSGIRTRRYHALLLTAETPPTGRVVLVNGLDAWVEGSKRLEVRSEKEEGEGLEVRGEREKGEREKGEWLEVRGEREFLTRQRYSPGIVAPENGAEIESFRNDPWPTWVYRLRNGARIEQEILVPRGLPLVALRWRLLSGPPELTLLVRPFLSGRDLHALQR